MENPQNNAAPTTEQDAAQPDTGAAPAKSAAETKLEGQLSAATTKGEGYKKERDAARKDLASVTKERDAARKDLSTALGTITAQGEEIEQLKREKAPSDGAKADATADEKPADTQADEHAETKAILVRNGLKKAWVLPGDTICFDEKHARHTVGDEAFKSLTVISAE